MPFDPSAVKWTILVGVTAVAGTLAVNAGYFLINLWLRGEPTQAGLAEARIGAPYIVLGIFLAAAGAILAVRLTAHWPKRSPRWTSLAVGLGLALLVFAVSFIRSGLNFWLLPNAFMAVVGSWLGGWVTRHV